MDFSFPAGDASSSCSFSKFQQVSASFDALSSPTAELKRSAVKLLSSQTAQQVSAAVDALSTAERIGQELARVARVPLPPYITATDGEGSYQTMFATESESGGSSHRANLSLSANTHLDVLNNSYNRIFL